VREDIKPNPYVGPDHWAYRVLGAPQEEVAHRRQLAAAMRNWPSAVLYPEQLFANARRNQYRDHQPNGNIKMVPFLEFRVYAVWFTGGAGGYEAKVRHHDFCQVRMKSDPWGLGGKGRATHVPRTILRWDMEAPRQTVTLVGNKHQFKAEEIKLEQFIPWIRKGSNEEQTFSMNMLFGDRRDAYSFAQAMLYRIGNMYPVDVMLRGLDRLDFYRSMA
jgi:hypothetical protein